MLEHGYRNGGGSVARFEAWLPQMTGDDEPDAGLWFVAESDKAFAGAVALYERVGMRVVERYG